MTRPDIMLCSLVEEMLEPSKGSTRDRCTGCKREVWISPSGRLQALVTAPHCSRCAAAEQRKRGGQLKVIRPNAKQMAELRAAGIDASADELQAMAFDEIMRRVNES